jgi:GNAT superfamily N-acetyltransferase
MKARIELKFYAGFTEDGSVAFRYITVPTASSHSYQVVLGPFSTMAKARFVADSARNAREALVLANKFKYPSVRLASVSAELRRIASFIEEVTGAHHDQVDVTLSMQEGGVTIGTLEYTLYQGVPHIAMIHIVPQYRGKGYGKKLIKQLTANCDCAYTDIEWGMVTGEGLQLRQSLDKEYGVDRKKLNNSNLCRDILDPLTDKDEILHGFVTDMYRNGRESAWNRIQAENLAYMRANGPMLQDMDDILEWVDGSKTNRHHSEELPSWVRDVLETYGLPFETVKNATCRE